MHLPISLVIAASAAEAPIGEAIASVMGQACVPAEMIVVDTSVSERTNDIASATGARVLRLPHDCSPAIARNRGIAAATEPWVALLDADDLWHEGKLRAQWTALRRWPDAAFCFTGHDVAFDDGQILPQAAVTDPGYLLATVSERVDGAVRFRRLSFARALVHSLFFCRSSVIVNRERFLQSGGYDERLRLGEESELYFRLLETAPPVAVERSLVTNRQRTPPPTPRNLTDDAAIRRLWSAVFERTVR